MAAAQLLLDVRNGEVDVHPVQFVHPAGPDGQTHPVQHQAIKHLGLHREVPKQRLCEQGLRNAVKRELFRFMGVIVVEFG